MSTTITADDRGLFTALQLADGTFPSGRYTLSHGLESFIQEQRVQRPEQLQHLLEDYIVLVVASTDAVATAAAARAVQHGDLPTLVDADLLLFSVKSAHEAATSSCRTGHGLLRLACELSNDRMLAGYAGRVRSDTAPGNYAVAFGVLAAAWGLPPSRAAAVELYSFAAALLGVALRIFSVDHTFAQRTLHALAPLVHQAGEQAAATDYRDIGAFAPVIDIMQMHHEQAYVRLFGS